MEFLLSLVIVCVGFLAGLVPFLVQWTHTTAHRWIAFGAGVILGAAFVHMIPEAYRMAGPSSLPMVLAGFVALYAVEQVSLKHPHDEERGKFHELGLLTFFGLALHDLIDGIALGSGHHIPRVTPAIFAALLLHKIPTMFSLSLLMIH
ncbi:MAG TPA: ZIP family metal transporter, partial [Thermoanaerobaculia bacterium]|nr:ZIP family metal transporter [Thermoanaerobaculia bacterium]